MVQYLSTPIGLLKITADQRKLRSVEAVTEKTEEERPNFLTEQAVAQLEEYFSGKRTDFTVFFLCPGTELQQAVWSKLSQIPYGKVVTYGQLAAAIGRPTAVRAVANAVGQNPCLILLPCHRVVSAEGMGGFSLGVEAKKWLLTHENISFSESEKISRNFLFTFD